MSKPKNPFVIRKRSFLYNLAVSPGTHGAITAAAFALSPKLIGKSPLLIASLPGPLSKVPRPVLLVLLGFPVGYVASKTLDWLRWRIVQQLLDYQGWVYGSKSPKTKIWAMLLKFLQGPYPTSTYIFQRHLPKQPLPDLDQTLDLWLKVSSHIVNKEEFEHTKDAVDRFRTNEGPKIQQYLQNRSKNTVNWLSDYWLNAAYLSNRDPLPINSNYFILNKKPEGDVSDQMVRTATIISAMLKFYELVNENKLTPVQLMDLVPLCMNGYRYIFNALRQPGEHLDRILRYPGETHIVILRKGHYYVMDSHTQITGQPGKRRMLRQEEIKLQIERICQHADKQTDKPHPVAALTTLNRTKWAKLREKLAVKNSDTLKTLESSMFLFTIDDQTPKDINEHCNLSLSGRGHDRWFDKCFHAVTWPSCVFGAVVEHSGVDATVFCTLAEYLMATEKFVNGDVERTVAGPDKHLAPPVQMHWNVEEMEDEIKQAYDDYQKQIADIDVHTLYPPYGKGFMKKVRLSPDGYIQMAFQLAYYRLHKETPKTYEPSTGRLFALGRTENIHPVSTQSKTWVRAMHDPLCTKQTKQELLHRAVKHQNTARLHATVGQGCDRHLLGMYCASREMEMDIPAIFLDKAFRSPFKLSTSQTPTRTAELGVDSDLRWVIGGFGPTAKDGYGISYVNLGDDLMNIPITSWKHSEETDSAKMGAAIVQAMEDMKALFA